MVGKSRHGVFISALVLLNCCVVTADGGDGLSEADAAYQGEGNGIIDLLETREAREAAGGLEKQVKIVGDTSILATLRTFGKGGDVFQVRDADNGVGMVMGADSNTNGHMRMKPTKGKGIGIHSAEDAVGVFVDAKSGHVGIGHTAPKAELHVKGTTYSSGPITADAGNGKAAVQLTGVTDYYGIQLGRDGKQMYLIGRGSNLEAREMSFQIPSMAEYGSGEQPKFRWVSGAQHTTLASLQAETGNMFVKGRLGIGTEDPKSELDVRGSIHLQNDKGEGIISFPKGRGSGFVIRSSDNPAQTTADSDNRFYISGENGFTGISTATPKTMLDVRGDLNLQDSDGAGVIYFSEKGKKSNFYLRCADDPSVYAPEQERLFVGSNGMVGIGTTQPSHGLTLDRPGPPGSKMHDIAIKKGSLRLGGAIYDISSDSKYYLDLKKGGFLRSLNVEHSLAIGTSKPVPAKPGSAVIHVSDPVAPAVRIENTKPGGAAALELQAGSSRWSVTGTSSAFQIARNNNAHFTITQDGKVGIGASKPTHGLTISSNAPAGDPRNDLSIPKGHLWIGGDIMQVAENGESKYKLSLGKEGSLLKNVNVEKSLGIGLGGKQPKFNLELGLEKVMSFGNQMFISGESTQSYLSANLYRQQGQWSLANKDEGGSVVSLKTGGEIEIAGTVSPGSTELTTMMSIDAASELVSFPMRGLKAGFGTSSPEYPIHVVGSTKVGDVEASIGFGSTEEAMGYLGANDKYVFVATNDGQEALTMNQNSGNVGIGTNDAKSTLHIVSPTSPSLSIGSSRSEQTRAYIEGQPTDAGLNMVIGVKNPEKGHDKLTFDFSNTVTFKGSGSTRFARGDTIFKSGNVGIGAGEFSSDHKLHVKGDVKVDGRVYVSKRRVPLGTPTGSTANSVEHTNPAPESEASATGNSTSVDGTPEPATAVIDHLDLSDLLEEEETSAVPSDVIDVVETMTKLSRVIRKQMQQMKEHDDRIAALKAQMATFSEL